MSTTAMDTTDKSNATTPIDSRRTSIARQKRGSIMWNNATRKSIMMSRPSIWNFNMDRRLGQIKLENTYKMEANDRESFLPFNARAILEEEIHKMFDKYVYDIKDVTDITQRVTNILRQKLKELPFVRYKLVVHIAVIENNSQGCVSCSRALWNDKSGDSYAEFVFRNGSVIVVGTVYGLYYE